MSSGKTPPIHAACVLVELAIVRCARGEGVITVLRNEPLSYESRQAQNRSSKGAWRVFIILSAVLVATPLVCIPLHHYSTEVRLDRIQQRTCSRRLGEVGRALAAYASANGGQYPDRLSMLYTSGYAEYQALTCDSRREAMTMEEFLDGLDDPGHRHSNFVYIGKGLTSAVAPTSVMIYEHLKNHRGDGINVLYADGTVSWLDDDAAAALIATLPPSTTEPLTTPMKR
jgi:hypothetical protein